MADIDFPNMCLEAVGLGIFWGCTLKVGGGVIAFKLGGSSSPI